MKAPTIEAAVNWLEDGAPIAVEWENAVWTQTGEGGFEWVYGRTPLTIAEADIRDNVIKVMMVKRTLYKNGRPMLTFSTESGPEGAATWKQMCKLAMECESES